MDNVPISNLDQPSTHASRNPGKPIIPPRLNNIKKSAAQKATAEVQRAQKRERKAALQNDIDAFHEEKENLAKELASKYNFKIVKVQQMLAASLHSKQHRRVSTWNALVARRGKELNEGKLVDFALKEPCSISLGRKKGDRLTLAQIQNIVKEDLENGVHQDVDEDELREELEDARKVKKQGARSSNKAAAVDYQAALSRVQDELGDLHERCGTMAFAFFTRGHIHDTIVPGWIESQGSLAFINDVLDMTPAEFLRKFELWACTKGHKKHLDTMASLRSECVNLIIGGLQKIVGARNVTMCYEKYDVDMVERYSATLRGWPVGLQFRSPAKITTMEDARTLRDALVSGECMWVKLTRKEKEARTKARQEKIASGEVTVKKRKRRSDAGKPRGPRKAKSGEKRKRQEAAADEGTDNSEDDSGKEDDRPKKKARKSGGKKGKTGSKIPPMPKSRKSISSDSSSEDD
ncbi:hypothetical protein C0992_013011 [Termitomyces sp. T32_za158]|nr:hypothetical protein C0992_013011 [Termitomyces sp. T32_za158]